MTKTSWGTYVLALSDSQSEIAERADVAQSTVSRWIAGQVPDAQKVVQLARAYGMSPVAALVAAGYLSADEITNPGTQPRALAIHEFTDRELARETLRRITGQPETLTPRELDLEHEPLTRTPQPRPARAWVRYGDQVVHIDVEVVAWTEYAIAIRWPGPDDTEHRAWVWAGAVRSPETRR